MSTNLPGAPSGSPGPLPCPFCGTKPEILHNLTRKDGSIQGVYTSVRCPNTACVIWKRDLTDPSKLTLSEVDAVRAWNREVKKL